MAEVVRSDAEKDGGAAMKNKTKSCGTCRWSRFNHPREDFGLRGAAIGDCVFPEPQRPTCTIGFSGVIRAKIVPEGGTECPVYDAKDGAK